MPNDIIFVTNTNSEAHVDMYDGVEFVFPPGERVPVPAVAATLMFGFNLKDKSEALLRLGWAGKMVVRKDGRAEWVEDAQGVKRLAKFVFTKAVLTEAPEGAMEPEAPLA